MTKKTINQTTTKNTASPAAKKSGRPPKQSKRDSPEPPMPDDISSEGKIQEISDSESERSGRGRPEMFNPEMLSKSQVQEIVALTLSGDRKAVNYIVIVADKKERTIRRKVICTRRDMRVLDERQKKRYRFDYLISYLRSHREED